MKASEIFAISVKAMSEWKSKFPTSGQAAYDVLCEDIKKKAESGGIEIFWDTRVLEEIPGLNWEHRDIREGLVDTLAARLIMGGFKVKKQGSQLHISWGSVNW